MLFGAFKLSKLCSALKRPGNAPQAFDAVLELGRIGNAKAVDLLIGALARLDGVSRNAARELGRIGSERAIKPLVELLANAEVNESAAEALAKLGGKSVGPLLDALSSQDPTVRRMAAGALGGIGDPRAVGPLSQLLQSDPEYAVRTAAATALGQLKDPGAIWALVGTLKLRDETEPERQLALEQLRTATSRALRKIGDPLKSQPAGAPLPPEPTAEPSSTADAATELHPRLAGDLTALTDTELVAVLKELISASEEISWASLEHREPQLAPHFLSYDLRRRTAETIGAELLRRGGVTRLKEILEQQLDNYSAIANWWSALGGWGAE